MAHSHAHGGHATRAGHARGGASRERERRALTVTLALIVAFMVVEVVVAVLASSLALLSDAAHMLTDAAALGLSLAAASLASRPARGSVTYGMGRAEILSALANGVTLLVLALLIVYDAIVRLVTPPHVHGGPVLDGGHVPRRWPCAPASLTARAA